MSKTRDEMAEKHLPYLTSEMDSDFLKGFCNSFIDQRRDAFKAGWDSGLKNAPEVLALVEALAKCRDEAYDLASELSNTEETQAYQTADRLADLASSALTQWKESTTKKREE